MDYFQVAGLYFSFDKELTLLSSYMNYSPFLVRDYDEQDFLFSVSVDYQLNYTQPFDNFLFTNEIGSYGVICEQDTYTWILRENTSDVLFLMRLNVRTRQAFINFDVEDAFTLQAADDFVRFAFIYAAAFHQTVLLHASCIKNKNRGIAFLGKSGIGKSTHSALWLRYIADSELMNDDQPAVRIFTDRVIIYGTPWSGKTPCYKNICTDLSALVFMEQSSKNDLQTISNITLFTRLLSACSLIKADKTSLKEITNTLAKISETVKGGILKNRPEKAAALLSYQFLEKY